LAKACSNGAASFLFIFLFITKMNGTHSSHQPCLAAASNASALLFEKCVEVFRGSHTLPSENQEPQVTLDLDEVLLYISGHT
jgi:hypothetical protein